MAQRIYREATPECRKKQSEAMVAWHASRNDFEKQKTATKQSQSMKQYWAGLPSRKKSEGAEEEI